MRTELCAPAALIMCVCVLYFLTYRLQGTGPAASSQCGPGQSAVNGSTGFGEQWTLGFFQKLHTYTPGWYTLRSGGRKRIHGSIKATSSQVTWELWLVGSETTLLSETDLHLSGWSGKTWGRNYRTGRLQQTDPKTQRSALTETCTFPKEKREISLILTRCGSSS